LTFGSTSDPITRPAARAIARSTPGHIHIGMQEAMDLLEQVASSLR
jgi:hypothetical protein